MHRLSIIAALLASAAASAATLTVTTDTDTIANDGACSLREAVSAANADSAFNGCAAGSGADLILLAAGEYRLERAGAGEDGNLTGDLDIRSSLTIRGAAADLTRIRGDREDRVFDVRPSIAAQPISVVIEGVTIRDGNAGTGGAIFSDAGVMFALERSSIVNNVALQGAGIAAMGGLAATASTFHANSATSGGAIWTGGGSAVLRNLTFDANSSLLSGSVATFHAPATLNNVTLSQNVADSDFDDIGDGAIEVNATVTISNSIVARNLDLSLGGSMQVNPDCVVGTSGSLVSAGHNLVGNIGTLCVLTSADASDQIGTPAAIINPRLQPFGLYGGPVETFPPMPASPAVERGSAAPSGQPGACEALDARGVLRPQATRCDIGAAELEEIIFRDGFDPPLP